MTEDQWNSRGNAQKMLNYLRGKASPRKFRLFAVACCRMAWPNLADQRSREAVAIAERYADGSVSDAELGMAWESADAAARASPNEAVRVAAAAARSAVWWSGMPVTPGGPAEAAAAFAAGYVFGMPNPGCPDDATKLALLLDVFGNPFRHHVSDPSWLSWHDGAISRLAQRIYGERRFGDLPLLADMLTDAGCADAELLEHQRSPGPHVRGCWALDAVLGKG